MRSGKHQGSSWCGPNPRPLKPRGRKVGKAGFAGLVPRISWSLRAKRKPLSGPGRRERSRNRRAEGGRSSRSIPTPDGTGAGASAGRNRSRPSVLARACRIRHQDAGRQVSLGTHTPVRVGSTARSAPFLLGRPNHDSHRANACAVMVSFTVRDSFPNRHEPLRFMVNRSFVPDESSLQRGERTAGGFRTCETTPIPAS